MPQITRTTTGMSDPGTSEIQTRIDNLRSRFSSGGDISASDINELISMFTRFNDHYHVTDDYAFEAYGNTAPTGSFYDTSPENTSRMYDRDGYYGATGGREPAGVSSGDTILASKHEEIRIMYDGANGHYHTIDDRVY